MATRKQLTAGEKSGIEPASETVDLATEPARYQAYLRLRNYAAVAREAGVTPRAIKRQAHAASPSWPERAAEHDRRLGLSRAASASQKTLGTLDAVGEVIAAEAARWDEPAEDGEDRMVRAGAVVQVLDRASKLQREALADLPAEKPPELDLSPLSNQQLALWLAHGEIEAALRETKPGAPFVLPARADTARVILALLESAVAREFFAAYAHEHGLNGTLGLL